MWKNDGHCWRLRKTSEEAHDLGGLKVIRAGGLTSGHLECFMLLPTTLTALFFPFLHPLLDHGLEERPQQPLATPSPLQFQLRHLHAVSGSAQVVLSDITAHRGPSIASHRSDYALQSRPVKAYRPSSSKEHAEARRLSIYERQSSNLRWDEWEIPGPDTESRKTLLELAKMTNNAYVVDNNDTQWYELDKRWTDVRCVTHSPCACSVILTVLHVGIPVWLGARC